MLTFADEEVSMSKMLELGGGEEIEESTKINTMIDTKKQANITHGKKEDDGQEIFVEGIGRPVTAPVDDVLLYTKGFQQVNSSYSYSCMSMHHKSWGDMYLYCMY